MTNVVPHRNRLPRPALRQRGEVRLARFAVEATPPMGHPLCGGWIKPVVGVDDPLSLRGLVVLGAGDPVVLATLDATGLLNLDHVTFRQRLAHAVGTTPQRVALHCVHQHNAVFFDRDAHRMVQRAGLEPSAGIVDPAHLDDLMDRAEAAARGSLAQARTLARFGVARAEVERIASNRRILGPEGTVVGVRTSSTRDPALRAAPEGLIDREMTVWAFHDPEGKPLARVSFYAVHPMSYYGDGRVSSDFVGLARCRRDWEEPGVLHLCFTGAAGNITAGKYNDGLKRRRGELTDRYHDALRRGDAEADAQAVPLTRLDWRVSDLMLPPRTDLDPERLRATVADARASPAERHRAALAASWLERCRQGVPIPLGTVRINDAAGLFLPGETFVEYQLDAKARRPDLNVAVAAYGDGGPWYIPLARSFREGGYEPGVAFVGPEAEPLYRDAIFARLDAI